MRDETITKEEAQRRYGDTFIQTLMKGKNTITLTPRQKVMLEKYALMRRRVMVPFAYEYVYLVANDRGHFKIGHTQAIKSRLTGLNGGADVVKLHALVITAGKQSRNIERALHSEFTRRGQHFKAEWFSGDTQRAMMAVDGYVSAHYSDYVFTVEEAWDGSEPLMQLYRAVAKNAIGMDDAERYRSDFLWMAERVKQGVRVLGA